MGIGKQLRAWGISLALVLACSGLASAEDFKLSWSDGIKLSGSEGTEAKVAGRIMSDWVFSSDDDELKTAFGTSSVDGVQFRRARVELSGKFWENIEYANVVDFSNGVTGMRDSWIALTLGWGTLKVGQQKELFSLEELTSSKYISFMERSLVNTFVPGFQHGLTWTNSKIFGPDQAWWLGAGIFKNGSGSGASGGDGWDLNLRVAGSPWYEDEGRNMLHIGVGAILNGTSTSQFRPRLESSAANRYLNTGAIASDGETRLLLELAVVLESLSIQAEYAQVAVKLDDSAPANASDPTYTAASIFASYWLTGERRPYSRSSASFGRVKPKKDFSIKPEGGNGAFEVLARFSMIDLDEAEDISGINFGGSQTDITVGLNWHLNRNVRVMTNFVMADIADINGGSLTDTDATDDDGSVSIVQFRFQIDF